MAGMSRTLPVPYVPQPTDTTCQSTVLKMVATYLENEVLDERECKAPVMMEKRLVADLNTRYHPGGDVPFLDAAERLNIEHIKDTINGAPGRPDTQHSNSHANMMWWLERRYAPAVHCDYFDQKDRTKAIAWIVEHIDAGFPVIASVSHENVEGHIILIVGYENYTQDLSRFNLIIHDPYGAFDPSLYWGGGYLLDGKIQLFSKEMWGAKRFERGLGQYPGQFNHVPVSAASRHRPDGIYRKEFTGIRRVKGRSTTITLDGLDIPEAGLHTNPIKFAIPEFEAVYEDRLTNDPARGTYYLISFERGAKQSWWSPKPTAAAPAGRVPGKPAPAQQKFPAKQSL